MEAQFRALVAEGGPAWALAILYMSATAGGMIIMALAFPLCRDLAHWIACLLTNRTRAGNPIHRDHVDPRLETLQ